MHCRLYWRECETRKNPSTKGGSSQWSARAERVRKAEAEAEVKAERGSGSLYLNLSLNLNLLPAG